MLLLLLLGLFQLLTPTYSNHRRENSACVTSVPIAGETRSITTSTGETRCFTVYRPETAPSPTPVIVYFHDRGEDAIECGRVGSEFVRQAYRDGFALVCAEAADPGNWRFGNYGIVNDNNANPCTSSQANVEKPYIEQIFKYVRTKRVSDYLQATSVGQTQPNTNIALSIDRLYLAGYGEGSNFAAYVAFCFPSSVSGMVQAGGHGYKRKGDGIILDDGAGECADCMYYPVKVLPALSIGRTFKHCAFASTGDTISPPTLHQAMCTALNSNGHSSTLYMYGDDVGHVRPTNFIARAALCLQIGGATAPPPPPTDSCISTPLASTTTTTIINNNGGQQYGNHLSNVASPTLSITADACPAWDWLPTLTSHQCPCSCDGVLPDACSDACSSVTLLRRVNNLNSQKNMHQLNENILLPSKPTSATFTDSSSTSSSTKTKSLEYIACPPGYVPTASNNFCMNPKIQTTTTSIKTTNEIYSTIKITTSGCPSHNVDNSMSPHDAMYQQYTVEIPHLDVSTPLLQEPIPSFGGPVGISVDGAFLYNPLTANKKDAIMSEAFDQCFGQSDELGRYHYHTTPLCLFELLGATYPPRSTWHRLRDINHSSSLLNWVNSWPEQSQSSITNVTVSPSPLIGWALDGVPIYGPYDESGQLLRWGGSFPTSEYPNATTRLDACNGRVRPTDGRYVYHMTPSPPYTVGCFRGGRGLGVAKGRALSKKCPIVNTTFINDMDTTNSAMHHKSLKMCDVASKVTEQVVTPATNIDGSIDGSKTIGSVVRKVIDVVVTVEKKTVNHPRHPNYHDSGTTSMYSFYLNGEESANFYMMRGLTYRFFMNSKTYSSYPFYIYRRASGIDNLIKYVGGDVSYTIPTASNNYLFAEFRADSLSPRTASSNNGPVNPDEQLTFSCPSEYGMGGEINFYNSMTEVVKVTVKLKTLSNPYHPSSMPNASPYSYYFNNVEASSFIMIRGKTYIFDQTSDSSNNGHPLRFYLTNERVLLYGPHTNELTYPGVTSVVGIVVFTVGKLTPRKYTPNTPNSLSFQSSSSNRMGGIVSIVDEVVSTSTTSTSTTTTTTTTSSTEGVTLSALALEAAFASAPPSVGTVSTAVKQDLNICKAYMGKHVNTCLCYESNPSGTGSSRSGVSSNTKSSSASIRLCAAECSYSNAPDGFSGTKSDGYDGTVEVLGWSCFSTVPSNIPSEGVSTLPEATLANDKEGTTASSVVAAAVTTATGGLPGVHVSMLQNATIFSYNTTYVYGAPRYVINGALAYRAEHYFVLYENSNRLTS
jgi:hypothetical protein